MLKNSVMHEMLARGEVIDVSQVPTRRAFVPITELPRR